MVPIKENLLSPSKYNLKCPAEATAAGMEYIVVHNTGNSASAENEVAYMIRNDSSTSFNAAVDDKEIVIGIPFNKGAFAAGQRYANAHGIHIEICYSLKDSDLAKFKRAEKNAAEYIAQLLKARGWGIAQVKKHQDFDGKYCPHRTLDLGWDRFRSMVQSYLDGGAEDTPAEAAQLYRVRKTWTDAASQLGAFAVLENAKKACKAGYKVFDAEGRVVYTPQSSTAGCTGDLTYQAYTQKAWQPKVVNCGDGPDGYAGIYGSALQGLKIDAKNCDVYYRVHTPQSGWLPEVRNSGSGADGYAGIYGQDIDGIQIRVPQGFVDCRVHLKNGDYLDWVRFGKSYKDGADGYAGILGRAIDGVQMK